ncbi:cell division protein FtsA [Heyndrickxia ginsengihumi]|uniref:Cell division protein FtsA n=1 Tax=Heyndrickxia ginsengihumi TaxID=363870 RepID=A0A0A6Y1Q6_9BACI|nr:cell division protein FtsA [Heyndrickxia ginsengihumi]KHD86212.1 cell division protein FtsA [Heyndrickxia ginsengihumi]MBE6183425.1 cell division protein FtsA [Bacillus sp. (in: firmicutes)]MCM3022408.1 cell division protein FtsA [Heyndrickxia ginsengihumi]NEY18649.1 cell division protein FtsA [Heyndrickxia ginsengihumi]
MNNNDLYVSLDIGTSTTKVIISEMVNDSINIIGVGNVESEGIKKGAIIDIDETVHSIRKAIGEAERMVGMNINNVIVGIPSNHVVLQTCHGVVAVSSENREITDEDVARVMDAAQVMSIPPEREIVNVIPKQFIVDGLDEINDPRGMIGVRLEMEGIIVTSSKTVLHNILRCVERAGLTISEIVLQPLAAGAIALSKDEKELGTVLVDIGGGCTTLAVFENGHIKATSVLPVGGDNITKDLSIVLRTSTEDAERVKVKHGHAFSPDALEDEVFNVPIIGSNQQERFNQLQISDIIEARLEEMFLFVQQELKRMGIVDLPGGIVLTGGTANLPGVLELAQSVFQNRVRMAIPDYIGVREPQYTTAVGLINYAYKNARLQGRNVSSTTVQTEYVEKKPVKASQPKQKHEPRNQEDKLSSKMKKFWGIFFE